MMTPEEIKDLRQAMGLTQTEFGDRLDITKMSVYRMEHGLCRAHKVIQKKLLRLKKDVLRRLQKKRSIEDEHNRC
jgi:DNA-binding transcriptional regulator YiaG